ncbi:hypothetical protein MBLNU459_g6529t1 [Dothideomycetes sp. NU459]
MSPKFTDHLLSHARSEFKAATTHPFLRQAGSSAISKSALLAWLTQDRLYALSYVSFVGALLSKSSVPSTGTRTQTLEWRVADCLIDALINIRRELAMFEDVLRDEFGWKDGGEHPRPETRAYQDLFAGAAAPNQSLLIGMTVLWATEKSYLEAWRFAKSQARHVSSNADEDVLQNTLIPNWTSDEFAKFVDQIGELLDELAQEVPKGGREWGKCEEAWRQVLWAEERFWPAIQA